jgi:hypothetical protein
MAKLKSLLKIEGTLDGMTFYKSQTGDYLVKTKSGVSKSRIDNDPAFRRTRENGQEFGHIASSGKQLRRALSAAIYDVKDPTMTYRLTKGMGKVKNLDTTSLRGQRKVGIGIQSPEGKTQLRFFEFNNKSSLDAVLRSDYVLDIPGNQITLPDMNPMQNLGIPQGATHVEFSAYLLDFDFETNVSSLQVSNKELKMITNLTETVTLIFSEPPSGTVNSFYALKVAFYQEMNSELYPLNNGAYNAFQLVEVI